MAQKELSPDQHGGVESIKALGETPITDSASLAGGGGIAVSQGTTMVFSGAGATPSNFFSSIKMRTSTSSPDTEVDVEPFSVVSEDGTTSISVTSPITVDISSSGVINGLDSGAAVANTWYGIYGAADSSGVNPSGILLSTSFVAPALAGYDKFKRIGAVNADSSADLRPFRQLNNRVLYFTTHGSDVLAAQAASSTTYVNTVVYDDSVGADQRIPPSSYLAILFWSNDISKDDFAAVDVIKGAPGGSIGGQIMIFDKPTSGREIYGKVLEIPVASDGSDLTFSYKLSTTGGSPSDNFTIKRIAVNGYYDNL